MKYKSFKNKTNFKAFFKSITPFEYIWIGGVIVALVICMSLFPDYVLEDKTNVFLIICSVISIISSPICEMLISKQSRYWTMFSLFFVEITDTCVYFSLGLYSTALVSLLFWVPMDIITFVRWNKFKDEEKNELTKVKKLPWKWSIVLLLGVLAFGFGVGALLTLIPDSKVTYLVAFSNAFEIINGILILLRYTEQWFAWLAYLICQTIVYITLGHYIMLITIFAMLINTLYGFIKWLIYTKKHKPQEIKSEPS